MASVRRLLAGFCVLLILATSITSAQSASCCLRYTRRRLSCKVLVGYTVQNIKTSCDIRAVIFHMGGRFVCADPLKEWTIRTMKCLDDRKKKQAKQAN